MALRVTRRGILAVTAVAVLTAVCGYVVMFPEKAIRGWAERKSIEQTRFMRELGKIVSECERNGVGVDAALKRGGALRNVDLEVIDPATRLLAIHHEGYTILLGAGVPPPSCSPTAIACTAADGEERKIAGEKPVQYRAVDRDGNCWFSTSRIPPVPGCCWALRGDGKEVVEYPEIARKYFAIYYPELASKLATQNYTVVLDR
jgi:hypothetical protein